MYYRRGNIPGDRCTGHHKRDYQLTKHREALQMTVIKGSVNILNSHLRTTDGKSTRKRRNAVRYHIQQTDA